MKKAIILIVSTIFFINLLLQTVNALNTSSISISAAPSFYINYPTNLTVSCARITGDPTQELTLWRDDHIIANGFTSPILENIYLPVGQYNYTCRIAANVNYTEEWSPTNTIVVTQPADTIYIVLNATNNTLLNVQYNGDYGQFENDTMGFCSIYQPETPLGNTNGLNLGKSDHCERFIQRWNLTNFPYEITQLISARSYLFRDQRYDSYYVSYPYDLPIGVYEISNLDSSVKWNEYTMKATTTPCGTTDGNLNASCNSTANYVTLLKPNINSTLFNSWDITNYINHALLPNHNKTFSVIYTIDPVNNREITQQTNTRWYITSKENGTIITYPQKITVPQLILLFKTSGMYNETKLNQSLELSFSPSISVPINTTVTISCARIYGDPNSVLTLTINGSINNIPFSNIVAQGTSSPQYENRFVNQNISLGYTCSASDTSLFNSATTYDTLTVINTTIGSACNFIGTRCLSNYTGVTYSTYYNLTNSLYQDYIYECVNETTIIKEECYVTFHHCNYINDTYAVCGVDALLPQYSWINATIPTGNAIINFLFVENYGLNGIATIINFMVSTTLAAFVIRIKSEYVLRSWLICFGIIAFICSVYIYPIWLGIPIVIIEVLISAWIFVKFGKGLIGG